MPKLANVPAPIAQLMSAAGLRDLKQVAEKARLDRGTGTTHFTRRVLIRQTLQRLGHVRIGPLIKLAHALRVEPSELLTILINEAQKYGQERNSKFTGKPPAGSVRD